MNTIIIGMSSPVNKKIGSEAIKWYLNTDYSHIYIKMYSKSLDRTMIYHAAHGLVHFIEESNFLSTNKVIKEYELTLSDQMLLELKQKCIDLSGVDYGYDELPKIVIKDICVRLNIPFNVINSKGYICSELVAEILEAIFKVKFEKPKYLITPKDIDIYLTNNIL